MQRAYEFQPSPLDKAFDGAISAAEQGSVVSTKAALVQAANEVRLLADEEGFDVAKQDFHHLVDDVRQLVGDLGPEVDVLLQEFPTAPKE